MSQFPILEMKQKKGHLLRHTLHFESSVRLKISYTRDLTDV